MNTEHTQNAALSPQQIIHIVCAHQIKHLVCAKESINIDIQF